MRREGIERIQFSSLQPSPPAPYSMLRDVPCGSYADRMSESALCVKCFGDHSMAILGHVSPIEVPVPFDTGAGNYEWFWVSTYTPLISQNLHSVSALRPDKSVSLWQATKSDNMNIRCTRTKRKTPSTHTTLLPELERSFNLAMRGWRKGSKLMGDFAPGTTIAGIMLSYLNRSWEGIFPIMKNIG